MIGENIPPFLIASITSSCNLHCTGCYSRQNHACTDAEPVNQLTAQEWENIFSEAGELGISFILLVGGEPLLRWDVIEVAGNYPEILFPVFTNGTLLNDEYIRLFDKKRNLLPILSIEGRLNLFYGAPTVFFISHRKQNLQSGIEWANVTTVTNQMHLAATNLGLGSVYIWGALESMRLFPKLDHTDVLELPDEFEPLIALAVGYPETELGNNPKQHTPISVNFIK